MQTNKLLSAVLNDLADLKAIDITPLDVRLYASITDYMVVATGSSSRHAGAIADKLVRNMKIRHIDPLSLQADHNNEWILVDLGEVVVHIMQPQTRAFYNLEKLWAPRSSRVAYA